MRHKILNIIILLSILFFSYCTTEKNTFVTRAYHNLTAHYNAYFNGKESFKQGVKKVENSDVDNYTTILSIFLYSKNEAVSGISADMDRAIEKASKVIKLHSITVKPKMRKGKKTERQKAFYAKPEYCNWVYDSYLLMGKAQFYKHDFYSCMKTFKYIISQYSKQPVSYPGRLWLAKTYCELKRYNKARELLENLEADNKFPKKLYGELYATFADYYLKQKRLIQTIPELEKAIQYERKKHKKTRYTFILAQIYQQLGEYSKAYELYGKVVKMNPPYDMAFNAKINRATSVDINHSEIKEIVKQLNKMLKDDKNIDYQDQIYYALAEIVSRQGNIPQAIKYYKMSVKTSVNNTDQKAISYLALAKIYLKKEKYLYAHAYFDSALIFLDEEYYEYRQIKALTENLTQLVENIKIIEREDSLQRIARMSPEQRNKFIDRLIKKLTEEEQRQRELEQQMQTNRFYYMQNQMNNRTRYNQNQNQTGKWYFYNLATISYGKNEFIMKWGRRKLEDNWRRKNKQIIDISPETEETFAQDSTINQQKKLSNKTREYYLVNLPLNDSLMHRSDSLIVDAMFNIGKIYKDKILNFPKAIQSFENLNKRFPENIYIITSCYYLYQLYNLTANKTKAEYYKNLIITKYPESKYAKMLSDPDYFKKLEEQENIVKTFYEQTYQYYKNGYYYKVLDNCNYADSVYKENSIIPKFKFLKAQAIGKIKGVLEYKELLTEIVKNYPASEVRNEAQTILAYIEKGDYSYTLYRSSDTTYSSKLREQEQQKIIEQQEKQKKLEQTAKQFFVFNPDTTHYYIIITKNKKAIINRLIFNLINFNVDFFNFIDFQVNSQTFGDNYQIIFVQELENKPQATKYFKTIKKSKYLFQKLKNLKFEEFIISANNFKTLIDKVALDEYKLFYNKYYHDLK